MPLQLFIALHIGFGIIYQRCLAIEMEKQNVQFSRELEIPIFYEGKEVGTRRVDFLVDDKIMVGLKAVNSIENTHIDRALNYLEAYNLEIGLLINFGSTKLEF